MKTRLLSAEDISAILRSKGIDSFLDDLIQRLADAFLTLDPSNSQIPPRTGIHYRNPDLGLIEWMPASIGAGTATLKIVGYHPSNPDLRNLPTILSSIGIFDTDTGHLRGLLDGTLATALRTGAMSAVATRAMTENTDQACTLGLIGCGAQAVTQTHALSRIRQISKLLVYDIDPNATRSLSTRLHFLDIQIESVEKHDLNRLLEESDILCTATSADPGSGPLFADFVNKPKLHINAVGSDFPEKIELPEALLSRSFVCPDFLEQARAEGECQQLERGQIASDLSGVLKSTSLQEKAKSTISVFDSTGHAFADYVTALTLFDAAGELGVGTDIELECVPPDPKDPYSTLDKDCFLAPQKNVKAEATI